MQHDRPDLDPLATLEGELRALRTLPRREALRELAALGLAPAAAWALLGPAPVAAQQPAGAGRRGGGGNLRVLLWQGPTMLNPHFATGTKDVEGARVFYEALARWDGDGELQPVLAAEIPSRANGGVAADGRSVTWKLKKGVTWHDGAPFSADDLLFNAAYASDPATAATSSGLFDDLKFVKLDSHTVRVEYPRPTPFWAGGYCTYSLIPRHLFAAFTGARSREAAANFKPVGTGPFRFVDFRPGDSLRATLNPNYHQSGKPFFDSFELKGGGDAPSAARAVLQTGEYDFAGLLQVEDEVLRRMEAGGKGRVTMSPGGTMEMVMLNFCDPWTERDGERSHPDTRHPMFSDEAVRRALALCIDRSNIVEAIYGRTGVATPNIVHNPARFRSANLRPEFNPDKAAAMLDAAGWKRGPDGVRSKDGRRLKLLFQTSVNAARQKTQAAVKSACARAGIELELKSVTSAVFFSADVANPDTNGRFHADIQMYASGMGMPDPGRFMDRYVSWEVASKANKWQGRNAIRWRNEEYDRLYRAAETELDPVKRVAQFVRMNDLVCGDGYLVPLMFRLTVTAAVKSLVAPVTGWDQDFSSLADWRREGA